MTTIFVTTITATITALICLAVADRQYRILARRYRRAMARSKRPAGVGVAFEDLCKLLGAEGWSGER